MTERDRLAGVVVLTCLMFTSIQSCNCRMALERIERTLEKQLERQEEAKP